MRTMILPVLAALALAGCGGRAPEAERTVTTVNSDETVNTADAEANATGNAAQGDNALATVLTLNDAQRNGVFYRALEDAGVACQKVTSSDRMPDQDGKPLWRANCGGKIAGASSSHMITITPDGIAHIVSRSDR